MKNDYLVVNIDSFTKTKTLMDNNFNELLMMINKYQEMIENTKDIYNTESSILYRKVALEYIAIIQKYLNENLKPYIDKLDEIKDIYMSEYNNIYNNIQGGINE